MEIWHTSSWLKSPVSEIHNNLDVNFQYWIKYLVNVLSSDRHLNLVDELITFLSVYRNTPHPSTGKSPNELVKRYPVLASLPRLIPSIEDQDVHERDASQKMKMKENLEKRKITRTSLGIGQPVLVRQRKENKLTPKFEPSLYHVTRVK